MRTEQGQEDTLKPSPPRGGEFLLRPAEPEATSIPEELDAEARLIGQTMQEFVRREVLPLSDRLEAQEPGLMRSLVKQAGLLGLLAIQIPDRYGGLNLTKSVTTLLTEAAAVHPAFALSIGIHSGVGTLPLLLFGSAEQKEKYLPLLATGEKIAAFALSEANSGSDALAAECRAALAPDGSHYLLTGTKFWITNAGFADLFTVFAKVDGEAFTAFLVERDFPGVFIGPEEHKMGLKASSTCRLILENACVPVENVLGEVSKGGRVALYALNPGRFSIGASALGMGKENLRLATQYAMQRVQFGKPIIDFGLIQQKLANMAVRLFALESMLYRVAGWWDALLAEVDTSTPEGAAALRAAFEEYAIECAIIKVSGTETLDYIVDESLQIHGGFGYSEEFPAARAYRDARVYRIFEGTNEINRLTIADQLRRRVEKGRINLNQPGVPVETSESSSEPSEFTPLGHRETLLYAERIREAVLFVLRTLRQSFGDKWIDTPGKQEQAALLADTLTNLFACESMCLRSEKMDLLSDEDKSQDAARVTSLIYTLGASEKILASGRALLLSLPGRERVDSIQKFTRMIQPRLQSLTHANRFLANLIYHHEGYPF